MIAYITGKITSLSPASVVIENNGFGYRVHISLHTYSSIQHLETVKLYTTLVIKNEGQTLSGFELFGFYSEAEKEIFELLLSVNGVGASTARVMLSGFKAEDIKNAILTENEMLIQSVKGIGPKTAKRIILELKDKIAKAGTSPGTTLTTQTNNTVHEEALYALVALGYQRSMAEKTLLKISAAQPGLSVEKLIKEALKVL